MADEFGPFTLRQARADIHGDLDNPLHEYSYHSVLADGGETHGAIYAASEDEARAKLAAIYPGIAFKE